MLTPPVNHRYRGSRESKKLAIQQTTSIADIANLDVTYTDLLDYYDANIKNTFSGISEEYVAVLQRAVIVADFVRRTLLNA